MARPRKSQDKERIYLATDSGVSDINGETHTFVRGVTRVREGHPLLRAMPHAFKPIDAHYEVEQATAAPGERRDR